MPDRLPHRHAGGFKNIMGINYLGINNPHSNGHSRFDDPSVEPLALPLTQEFRLPEAFEATPAWKDDRRRHDRTGQRPASGLIHTSHAPEPTRPRFTLEHIIRVQRHAAPTRVQAPALMGSGAAVTGTTSGLGLLSVTYSRSATRAILPFLVRR